MLCTGFADGIRNLLADAHSFIPPVLLPCGVVLLVARILVNKEQPRPRRALVDVSV
jgi:hypothetical protein